MNISYIKFELSLPKSNLNPSKLIPQDRWEFLNDESILKFYYNPNFKGFMDVYDCTQNHQNCIIISVFQV